MKKDWRIETKAIQAGYEPKNGEPRVLPICQSTTYSYDTAKDVAQLFDLEAPGHMYTRISNPTVEAFENKIAALEGGVGAMACSAGQAASTMAILNICQSGQHFVCVNSIYGGTFNLFASTLKKLGIEVTFIDHNASAEEIKAAFQPNTRLLFGETLTNPGTDVLDFEKFGKVAKEMDVPLVIDNTFPTPYLCRPLELGANIVIHSATKYIDGHATSVGGVIIDGGNFNWDNGKYPELVEPDPTYHGLSYHETFGNMAYIVKARVQLLRDFGACMAPMNAFLCNLGLETLHVRMDRHCENALKLAEYLEKHPKVSWVKYPNLKSDPNYELSQKYLRGASGVLTFGVKGTAENGEKMMNSLELAAIVVHVADVRTSVLHPASMTHRQLSAEDLKTAGITPDLVRVSVGIENIEDIITDFEQALAKI